MYYGKNMKVCATCALLGGKSESCQFRKFRRAYLLYR